MGRYNTVNDYWNKVNKETSTGCWEWTGRLSKDGYGGFKMNHQDMQVHRWSMVFNGHDVKGLVVCHKCDNPKCVNPDHLFLGSQADNVKDMIVKGRYVKPQSKLSAKDIVAIQQSTDSYKVIGKRFNISAPYVCSIKQKVKA